MRIALMLLATLLPAPAAAAQTALLDTPLFHLYDDGGLVSLGQFGAGAIPASGAGTRLMWYPAKAAFRTGYVEGTEWNEASVGAYSAAIGHSTTASGLASTAMGRETTASGTYATATGISTTASGFASTAMGYQTLASGTYATTLGDRTTASGYASIATGLNTTASGSRSTAMGQDTEAGGSRSTAMGNNTSAIGTYTTTMGFSTTALAYASLVLSRYNVVAGNTSSWISSDPVLVVGNGTSAALSNRSNALTLLKNGNLIIAGSLTQNSDRRLKHNLRPLSDVVSGLGRLQPVRFRFRSGMNRPKGEHIGLIAQEVEAVFPELVSRGADGYLSVSYTHLAAVLVQALNEQQHEIEGQREQMEAQQTDIEALKAHLATQQTDIEGLKAELAALRDRLAHSAQPGAPRAR